MTLFRIDARLDRSEESVRPRRLRNVDIPFHPVHEVAAHAHDLCNSAPATGATEISQRALSFPAVMTRVETLEREVQGLNPEELAAFRTWFAEYDWQAWDRQLENDVAAGKLDALASEALAEFERGETTRL